MRIGNVEVASRLALAPMAGVTDMAFRQICRELGAGYSCTELVSAKALCYQDKKSRTLLAPFPGEHPMQAQIFGSDPVCMAEAAQIAIEASGADILDINMGCPVGKIVNNGDGSALMRDPEKAARIAEAVVKVVKVPVTVKMRRGWDKGSINAPELAVLLESVGVAAITVHGRTRVQMYGGQADWSTIRAVKEAVKIPVIANGGVFSAADADELTDKTGADGVMVARGALGRPYIFAEILGRDYVYDMAETVRRQIALLKTRFDDRYIAVNFRKVMPHYLKGVKCAKEVKLAFVRVQSTAEIEALLNEIH